MEKSSRARWSLSLGAEAAGEGSPQFMTTRWTMVLEAGQEGPGREAAMEEFAKAYWYPIYVFIRKRGHDAEVARDLTQGFFMHMLEKDWLSHVDRRATRFSTLLLNILRNFLIDHHRRESREKRGGGQTMLSLDFAAGEGWFGAEPSVEATPEALFEKKFAHAVLSSALERLRADLQSEGRGKLFNTLSPFLSHEAARGDYDAASATLGISNDAVAAAVQRLRKEYRQAVREEVGAGLTTPEQLEEEMRHLYQALAG